MSIIFADWPAPVIAGVTTRTGSDSRGVYAENNFGLHVGDDREVVESNRLALDSALPGKKQWQWLEQVHGTEVARAPLEGIPQADAAYSEEVGIVCTVLTADCLPILLADTKGTAVAAVHAGWRSLCYGVVEKTVQCFPEPAGSLLAWLGPAIGPDAFEVGTDVRDAFAGQVAGNESMQAFRPAGSNGKFLCDIYQLATIRLKKLGVEAVYGGGFCTVTDSERFYSYRRDGVTGRMASFIYRRQ